MEEASDPDSEENRRKDIDAMREKVEQLKVMLAKVNDRIQLEDETKRRIGGSTKMGARLKSGNELQEWIERQEYLKHNQE